MKKALLTILLLAPVLAWGGKPKQAPNPADYTIAVHVQSSRLDKFDQGEGHNSVSLQHLTVLIDGKKYELTDTQWRNDLLRVGDYKAKIVKDETDRAYEYQRTYEFLMSDGETRQYTVVSESE
jgi:hypothetical protein